MSEIDKSQIMNGTAQKRFFNARREMEEDFNQSSAREFFHTYAQAPVSFILKNSRQIFSEPYYGLPFYKKFIRERMINPLSFSEEYEKVTDYLVTAKKKGVSDEQMDAFQELRHIVGTMCEKFSNTIHACSRSAKTCDPEYNRCFYDLIDSIPSEEEDDDLILGDIAQTLFDPEVDPYVSIPQAFVFARKYPSFCGDLLHLSRYHQRHCNDKRDYAIRKSCRVKSCIRELMKDKCIRKLCAKLPNPNIYLEWQKLCDEPEDLLMESAEPIPESEPMVIESPLTVVTQIFEAVQDDYEREPYLTYRYDALAKRKAIYEAYAESLEEEIELGDEKLKPALEEADKIITGLSQEMAYMEWEADGSPSKVIRNHIRVRKDIEKEEDEKEKKDKETRTEARDEIEALEVVDRASEKLEKLAKKEKNKAKFNSKADTITKEISEELRQEIVQYPSVKEAVLKLSDSKKEFIQIFESGEEDEEVALDKDGKKEPEKKVDKTEKPKEDFATKVQNAALNHDAKAQAKDAKRRETLTKYKNAGKAFLTRPKREKEQADDLLARFDKWDDNRRKEFLLKPGNRHRIFKKMRLVLLYGGTAKLSVRFLPVAMVARHFSKQKDARIRNELIKELDAEVKICEEKINDANAEGDKKTKYELMRIKEKLKAERQRALLNSKYV